jgi:hypothetical protein
MNSEEKKELILMKDPEDSDVEEHDDDKDKLDENQAQWDWASTIAEGNPPSARGGHTATLIGKSIVVFGGHFYKNKVEGFQYLNDTYFLDIELSKWLKPTITGKVPPQRYGHSAIFAGGIILIFGGKGPKETIYNDLYTFDPDPKKNIWLLANETGEAPSPRFNHTANLWNKKMYIFGGWNGKDFFNDTVVYDLEKMVWTKLETQGTPLPRMGHASCIVSSNLIIQGGFYYASDQYKKNLNNYGSYLKSCYFNDLKVLDLNKNIWTQLKILGEPPQPRFGHTISFISKLIVLILITK